MELPERERLEIARRLVESVVEDQKQSSEIAQAIRGLEDVVTGRVQGLTEEEFRDALK